MAKLNEIVYDIREYLKEYSDDTETDDRHLIHLVNIKRAKYLRQDLNNMQKTTDLSIQQSFCLELEEVSSDVCQVDLNCDKILRSKKPIPKALELHTRIAITKIKPTTRTAASFNFISVEKAAFLEHSMFGDSVYAFIDIDNYVYLISKSDSHKLIECISISGIFENPLDLKGYKNCCGCNDAEVCFDELESEYPLQPHYIDVIKMEIVRELVGVKQIKEDKINDSTD